MKTSAPSRAFQAVTLPSGEFEMTAQRVEDYAGAIGDDNPRYRRRGRDTAELLVPPTLAAAFMQDPVRRMFDDVELLASLDIDGSRVVFGEITYEFAGPMRVGDWLRIEGELVGRKVSGAKEILTVSTRATRDDGEVLITATIVLVRI